MKKPLYLDGATVRDASGRVVISALNPCTMEERREIVAAVNATTDETKTKGTIDGN